MTTKTMMQPAFSNYVNGRRVVCRGISIYMPESDREKAAVGTLDPLACLFVGVAAAAGCATRARMMTNDELAVEAQNAKLGAADEYAGWYSDEARYERAKHRAVITAAKRELRRRGA